jgi:hypothetical protein
VVFIEFWAEIVDMFENLSVQRASPSHEISSAYNPQLRNLAVEDRVPNVLTTDACSALCDQPNGKWLGIRQSQ